MIMWKIWYRNIHEDNMKKLQEISTRITWKNISRKYPRWWYAKKYFQVAELLEAKRIAASNRFIENVQIREAFVSKKCSFFEHCSNGGHLATWNLHEKGLLRHWWWNRYIISNFHSLQKCVLKNTPCKIGQMFK